MDKKSTASWRSAFSRMALQKPKVELKEEVETMSSQLIDPSLLEGLTEEQKQEAYAAAAAAKRAEERAEQRALERAMEKRRLERLNERVDETTNGGNGKRGRLGNNNKSIGNGSGIKFVSKRQRKEQQESSVQQKRDKIDTAKNREGNQRKQNAHSSNGARDSTVDTENPNTEVSWTDRDRKAVRETYLGGSKKVNMTDEEFAEQKRLQKKKNSKYS